MLENLQITDEEIGMYYDGVINKQSMDDIILEHYGVIGMKWGVRKDPAKAYSKATAELAKRKKKSGERTKKKVYRLSRKAQRLNRKASRAFATDKTKAKAFKVNAKLSKALKKSAKADRRTARFERQMNKIFKDYSGKKISGLKQSKTRNGNYYDQFDSKVLDIMKSNLSENKKSTDYSTKSRRDYHTEVNKNMSDLDNALRKKKR